MRHLVILSIAFFCSSMAFAHCPLEIQISKSEIYCTDIEWGFAEQKSAAGFLETTTLSPVLVKSGTIPPLWLYSKATIVLWKKDDAAHVPQIIPNLRIFPYMHMDGGHHHSASSNFTLDPDTSTYQIQNVAFTEMKGCWSLRWTTAPADTQDTSQVLTSITAFTNVDSAQSTGCALDKEHNEGGVHEHRN